ncbi:MAG: metallophosphoesterase [Clostridia bacterium]|nr:metallophosphoesterase [Clostridia bacterium]
MEEVSALHPDAVVLTGDLTFSGAASTHKALAEKLAALTRQGIRVFVLPGNHDLYNQYAMSFTETEAIPVPSVSSEEFRSIYHGCGYDAAISCDSDSLSYAAMLDDATMLLTIDTNKENAECMVSDTTLAWMEAQLQYAKSNGFAVIAAFHQNIMQHSIFNTGYLIYQHRTIKELFAKYDVALALSGHLHMQHIKQGQGVTEIATSALSVWPCEYGIITANHGQLNYGTHRLDVAARAARLGLSDENLLHFDDYTEALLLDRLGGQARSFIHGFYPEEQEEQMVDYAVQATRMYFSGDLSGFDALDRDGSLRAAWSEIEVPYAMYIASVGDDAGKVMNQLTIPFPAR